MTSVTSLPGREVRDFDEMALSLDKEYLAAIEPLLAAIANTPKLAVGDIQGRRSALNNIIGGLIAEIEEAQDVKEQVFHAKSCDGHDVAIHHYAKQGTPALTSAIYYIHGGGYIAMDVSMYRTRLKNLASETGVPIFAVEYRLSPEVQYPLPMEDAWAGLKLLVARGKDLGVDNTRIAIMGDSAGGGLAACLALKARDEALSPPLAKQILIYPMLDNKNVNPNIGLEAFASWRYDDNITGWQAYLGGTNDEDVSQYAAAARASTTTGLPSTYMDLGELDIFRDEDLLYASRIASAGISLELHVYAGVPHAFEAFAKDTSVAKQAMINRKRAILSF
ncbi:hypothetical protein RBB50_011388 [Rhinocladiella similis]